MITAIAGSGRAGSNSTRLLDVALEASRGSEGRPARFHRLSDVTFRGCVGCGTCRADSSHESCVLRDDLTPVLSDTAAASALILAAPIYYGYPSGLFKAYLDRWYAFRGPDRRLRLPEGRKALLILTQGHGDPNAYAWTLQSLEKVLTAYGLRPSLLVATGVAGPRAVDERPDLLAEAARLGAQLA